MEKVLISITEDEFVENCVKRIELGAATSIHGIMQAGEAIDELRRRYPGDSEFGRLREARFPWLDRQTARHWRNIYVRFKDDASLITTVNSEFTTKALRLLSEPSTDDAVADAGKNIIEMGEKLDDDLVKRLKAEVENLKQDKEATIARILAEKSDAVNRLIQERDREKQKRKQAESISKSSDREVEQSRIIAQESEARMKAESLAASLQAQLNGGLGVAELLEPKVVIQRDPAADREISVLKKQLEEAKRLRDLADKNMAQMHEASLESARKVRELEKASATYEGAEVLFGHFRQQVMDMRSMSQTVAGLIQKKSITLDPTTTQACKELSERLLALVEFQKDAVALQNQAA